MNRKLIGFLVLLGLLVMTSHINAGYPTGQDLLIGCTGAYDDPEKATITRVHCIGYIDGVIDAHGIISSAHPDSKYFCVPPAGLSAGDAMDAVILYIQKVPEARSMSGRVVIIKALQAIYPCK